MRFIGGEWLKFSIRFIEGEWLRLSIRFIEGEVRWMMKIIEDEWLRLSMRFIKGELWKLSIRFIEGEWLRLSMRFIEGEWWKLLNTNDSDFPYDLFVWTPLMNDSNCCEMNDMMLFHCKIVHDVETLLIDSRWWWYAPILWSFVSFLSQYTGSVWKLTPSDHITHHCQIKKLKTWTACGSHSEN